MRNLINEEMVEKSIIETEPAREITLLIATIKELLTQIYLEQLAEGFKPIEALQTTIAEADMALDYIQSLKREYFQKLAAYANDDENNKPPTGQLSKIKR